MDEEKGINLKGFLALQHLLLLKGRLETIWAVLRQFGYDDSVHLRKEFIEPEITADLTKGERLELSALGKSFLANWYSRGEASQTGMLRQEDLDNIFSTAPDSYNILKELGYPDCVVTTPLSDGTKGLSLQGWMQLWSMANLVDHKKSFASINYLGFEPPRDQKRSVALQVTKLKDKKAARSALMAYVFGSRGSGKSTLLECHLGHPFDQQQPQHTTGIRYVVNSVKDRALVLCELAEEEKSVLESEEHMHKCDCAVVMYDRMNPASWSHAQGVAEAILEKYHSVPILLVAAFVHALMLRHAS